MLPRTSFNPASTASRTSTPWSPNGPSNSRSPKSTIRTYLTTNIHYVLDDECIEGMKVFFRMAAECGVLPPYTLPVPDLVAL